VGRAMVLEMRKQHSKSICTELACPQLPCRASKPEMVRRLHLHRHRSWIRLSRCSDGPILSPHCRLARRRFDDTGTDDHSVEARYEATEESSAGYRSYRSRIAVCSRRLPYDTPRLRWHRQYEPTRRPMGQRHDRIILRHTEDIIVPRHSIPRPSTRTI